MNLEAAHRAGARQPQGSPGAGGAGQGRRRPAQRGSPPHLQVQQQLRRHRHQRKGLARHRGRHRNRYAAPTLQGVRPARRGPAGPSAADHYTKARVQRQDRADRCDVRDALLDIASSQKQVEVARSSVELAARILRKRRTATPAGSATTSSVKRQAQQYVRPGQHQYVMSLYRHNVAKLSLKAEQVKLREVSKRGGLQSSTGPE